MTAKLQGIKAGGPDGLVADVATSPMTYTVLVRALAALSREDEALEMAATSLDVLEGRGAVHIEVRLKLLQALALDAVGRRPEALATVAEVVSVAELDGLIRPFVDEGTAMAQLLSALVAGSPDAPKLGDASRAFAARVLEAFPPGCRASALEREPTMSSASPRDQAGLVDPLTERELEILRYLGTELSTPEIADARYVAVSTVRSHVKSVYSKLGVHNRGEAVARAAELGLL